MTLRRMPIGCLLVLAGLMEAVLAQDPNKFAGDCMTSGCHDGYAKKPVVHLPVEQKACDACHVPKPGEVHKFSLKSDGISLCTECHEEDAFKGKVVHAPVEQAQCSACHDPHAAEIKKLLKVEEGKLCLECHEDTMTGLTVVHGPAAAGQCSACHQPHAAAHSRLLRTKDPDMCLECHSEVGETLSAEKFKHQPAESACLSCHKPHGASTKMFLAAGVPKLCADCHDEVTDRAANAKCRHSPTLAGSSCLQCHHPHAAAKGLLKTADAAANCLGCHNQQIKLGDRTIQNLAEHLRANPHHHGPLKSGECQACHDPHGADHHALLRLPYPDKFYTSYHPDGFKLCFECHEAEIFEVAEGSDTAFRNGSQNLHYLHVSRSFKSRSCHACHDPHAAQNPKFIADKVPFGKWQIPINFKANSTGGSCSPGCHQPYQYDREQPVDNSGARTTSLPAAGASGG